MREAVIASVICTYTNIWLNSMRSYVVLLDRSTPTLLWVRMLTNFDLADPLMLIRANQISSVSIHVVISLPYIPNDGITHCVAFMLFVPFVYLAGIANELKRGVVFELCSVQFPHPLSAYTDLRHE